ncbi:MAG: hypothetical protein O2820_24805 [Planctomycetota bacterium]|nr:hypothetical protein [Planctomycetota bacterium]MDA1252434.1 hypothetical protein [Planctomycetota bacterium]
MAVAFNTILEAFEFVSSGRPCEYTAWVNRDTGESYWLSELGDDLDELPGDFEGSDAYVEIPHKNDLDLGSRLVHSFVISELPDSEDEVQEMFRAAGGYRRFDALLERTGRKQDWFDYEASATDRALRQWCEENRIVLSDQA